jgi:4-amino-4-deoxy-L-arabinose transferase-like glycosyltransferase
MGKLLSKENLILFTILFFSFFLRVFEINNLLGFYYDQGRDGLVIWNFIHEGKFFLIGPVTGIEGIYRGPFYYYLITPFYLLGNGNPVFVSIWLSFISVIGIYVLYLLTKKIFDKETGLLAIFIYGLSYSSVTFSRWLSNPNPLPTFSILVAYFLLMIYKGKEKYWLLVGLFAGLSLQFETVSATFSLPAIIVFVLWQRSKIKKWKYLLFALLIFVITLLPQIIFNIRHDNILVQAFEKFLITEKSFRISFWQVFLLRLQFYYDSFTSRLLYDQFILNKIFMIILSLLVFVYRKDFFKDEIKILLIWIFTPLVLLLFYQGNYGTVEDHYLSGLWWVFILFVSFLFRRFGKRLVGKVVLILFLSFFISSNYQQFKDYYHHGTGIVLINQLTAIDWIYQDAKGEDFNVDVYVPPVIPYAYDYLFKWYGQEKYGKEPSAKNIKLLYTLDEADYPHPERRENWLTRQNEIGKVIYEADFGDIKVQKRERIKYYD